MFRFFVSIVVFVYWLSYRSYHFGLMFAAFLWLFGDLFIKPGLSDVGYIFYVEEEVLLKLVSLYNNNNRQICF